MQLDVGDLRDFYASPLGQSVRRLVGVRIRGRWRGMRGGTLVGLGFATPYLSAFRGEVDRLAALMPDSQGALVWPATGKVQTALVEEERLPLADNSVDRLLVTHGLEVAAHEQLLLRELWRVLAPEGRLMMVVPNRRGVWARIDRTPFGHGRPYSRSQIEHLLRQALFTPIDWDAALYFPPLDRKVLLRSAPAWERVGQRVSAAFAGVIVVEARKEIAAPLAKRAPAAAIRELVTVRRGPFATDRG